MPEKDAGKGGLEVLDRPEPDPGKAYTSDESEFQAPEDEHRAQTRKKTVGGRPVPPNPALGVPNPKFRLFRSDATNEHQRVKSFLNYWNALPEWAKNNTLLYIYREHPVLVFIERDPENRDQEFNYIDKISGAEPLQSEMDLLNRYGCGNYKLVFNEITAGKQNRTICTVYSVNLGGGDFKSNPPTDKRISDSKNVDLNHPSNQSYVAYLKGQGLLPNQIDAIRGEQEMATVSVIKESQETTNKLVDKVIKMAEDKGNRPNDDGKVLQEALTGAMDVMKKGAEAAIQTTREANEYAQKVREEADSRRTAPVPATPVADPLDAAMRIVTLLKSGDDKIERLRDEQMSILRDELKALRDKPTDHSGNPFNSIEAGLKAMKQMKEMTDEISGAGDKDNPTVDAAADALGAPKWLRQYAPLIQQGLGVVDGWLRMRAAQTGTPMMPPGYPPQGYPQNPQGYPPPQWNGLGAQFQQPQQQPGYQPPAPPPGPGPQLVRQPLPPAPGPYNLPPGLGTIDPAQLTPELVHILTAISTPLAMHLRDDDTGTAFADWFLAGFPQDTYESIVAFGVDDVLNALYSFPLTGQVLTQYAPKKVRGFVGEFLAPNFQPGDGDEDDHGPGDEEKDPVPETTPA